MLAFHKITWYTMFKKVRETMYVFIVVLAYLGVCGLLAVNGAPILAFIGLVMPALAGVKIKF